MTFCIGTEEWETTGPLYLKMLYTRESKIPEGLVIDPYFLVEKKESPFVKDIGVMVSSKGKGTGMQPLNRGACWPHDLF